MKKTKKISADDLLYYSGIDWQKVCRIKSVYKAHKTDTRLEWEYVDVDETLMYSEHRSWVYAITVNGKIFKFGETGNPLGIRKKNERQPTINTKNRFGRYRALGDSDETVRKQLLEHTENSKTEVEVWAYPCEEILETRLIAGQEIKLKAQIHKSLEKRLIDMYYHLNGQFPFANTGRY